MHSHMHTDIHGRHVPRTFQGVCAMAFARVDPRCAVLRGEPEPDLSCVGEKHPLSSRAPLLRCGNGRIVFVSDVQQVCATLEQL